MRAGRIHQGRACIVVPALGGRASCVGGVPGLVCAAAGLCGFVSEASPCQCCLILADLLHKARERAGGLGAQASQLQGRGCDVALRQGERGEGVLAHG